MLVGYTNIQTRRPEKIIFSVKPAEGVEQATSAARITATVCDAYGALPASGIAVMANAYIPGSGHVYFQAETDEQGRAYFDLPRGNDWDTGYVYAATAQGGGVKYLIIKFNARGQLIGIGELTPGREQTYTATYAYDDEGMLLPQ